MGWVAHGTQTVRATIANMAIVKTIKCHHGLSHWLSSSLCSYSSPSWVHAVVAGELQDWEQRSKLFLSRESRLKIATLEHTKKTIMDKKRATSWLWQVPHPWSWIPHPCPMCSLSHIWVVAILWRTLRRISCRQRCQPWATTTLLECSTRATGMDCLLSHTCPLKLNTIKMESPTATLTPWGILELRFLPISHKFTCERSVHS